MARVTIDEFVRTFGRCREMAEREPVVVTDHGRAAAVLISPRDFDEYRRLKALVTRAAYVEELPGDTLAAIAAARMDPRHADLDHL